MSKVNIFSKTCLDIIVESDDGTIWVNQSGLARMCRVNKTTFKEKYGDSLFSEKELVRALDSHRPLNYYRRALGVTKRISTNPLERIREEIKSLLIRPGLDNGDALKNRIELLISVLCRIDCQDSRPKCLSSNSWRNDYRLNGSLYSQTNYASIGFASSYNQCPIKMIDRRKLERASYILDYEVRILKQPTNQKTRLYHNDVWRLTYPKLQLLEE